MKAVVQIGSSTLRSEWATILSGLRAGRQRRQHSPYDRPRAPRSLAQNVHHAAFPVLMH